MDRVRSHFSDEITNIFKLYNSNYVLIPPGLTSILQPLDTHINKIFKYNIKNEYHQWLVKSKDISLNDILVIDFIYNAWYKSEEKNKEKIIENSFGDNGITLKTGGSEDNDFLKLPKEFTENMKIDINDDFIENCSTNIFRDKEIEENAGEESEDNLLLIHNGNNSDNKREDYIPNNKINGKITDNFNIIDKDDKMDIE